VSVGPATSQVVNLWLDDPAVDRLRTVGRLLRLGEQYGNDQLEAACQRALHFGEPAYATVKRILVTGLTTAASPAAETPVSPREVALPSPAYTFARSAAELLGHLFGGVTWN
jgi:transposase